MRPNLSFEAFARVIALVGSGAALGCGGDQAAEARSPRAGASTPSSADATGKKEDEKAGPPSSVHTTDNAAETSPPAAGATSPSAAPAESNPASAASSSGSSDSATGKNAGAKPKVAPKKPNAGQASCGAGTCAADPKKKIF